MMFTKADDIKLVIPRSAIQIVFDECDRYDADETGGGHVLSTTRTTTTSSLLDMSGIIEPGPHARRTATYFQQDGTYQERVFRNVEEREPSIEHLGNWHTHHVNGLGHLSDGDTGTYRRTVEHQKQNTDFFVFWLLRGGMARQVFNATLSKIMFCGGDLAIYEMSASSVTLTDAMLVWPTASSLLSR